MHMNIKEIKPAKSRVTKTDYTPEKEKLK
uniref:Uncharacterized protein n=1 Tax=Rhizophora mucronata TaxID=61149 RepID=A0A2P2IHW7_RHIMU